MEKMCIKRVMENCGKIMEFDSGKAFETLQALVWFPYAPTSVETLSERATAAMWPLFINKCLVWSSVIQTVTLKIQPIVDSRTDKLLTFGCDEKYKSLMTRTRIVKLQYY